MPKYNNIYSYEMPAAGSSITLNVSRNYDFYYLYPAGGSISLANNIVISPTGTPLEGMTYSFKYAGGVTLNGFNVTIFGVNLTEAQAEVEIDIECFYDGSAWIVFISTDNQSGVSGINGSEIVNASITNSKIAPTTLTVEKFYAMTARGYMYRAGAAGVVQTFNAVTAGALVMGNGTDVVSQVPTGHVLFNSAGVTTIQPGVITTAMLNFTPMTYYEAELELTSAQILALNATPLQIIGAPGAGKYIDLISASYYFDYSTAVYATNTTLQLLSTGSSTAILQDGGALISSISKGGKFVQSAAPAAANTCIALNTGVSVTVATGNPTAGSGVIKISVVYRILNR